MKSALKVFERVDVCVDICKFTLSAATVAGIKYLPIYKYVIVSQQTGSDGFKIRIIVECL